MEHFFRKIILIEKNIRSHNVLNGLNSVKFLEIVNSNKTPNIFSTYQLKIIFKHLSFARKPFLMFEIRTPLGLKHLNFRIFSFFYTVSTQQFTLIIKLHTSSRFARLRAVSKLFTFFIHLYAIYLRMQYIIKIDLNIKQDDG